MKKIQWMLGCLVSCLCFNALSQQVNGEDFSATPRGEKFNRLKVRTLMTFPDKLKTVRQVVDYLLEPIHYQLVISPDQQEETRRILMRPLLFSSQTGELKTIEQGLLEVAGSDTVLVVDHEHRLVTLEFDHNQVTQVGYILH